MTRYLLEARLEGVRPDIQRTLAIGGRYKLHQLHQALQILFGWRDIHLHRFQIGHRTFEDAELADPDQTVLDLSNFESEADLCGEPDDDWHIDERSARLEQVLRDGLHFTYEYDFGGGWRVQILVHADEDTAHATPVCRDGRRAGPPEDCGGVPGYYALVRDPRTKFDPEAFDQEAVQRRLDRRFQAHKKETRTFEPQLYDASQGPPRLENFHLASVNLFEQMQLALLEGPMTLQQIADRLSGQGIPVKHGVESLRKAWKRRPPIREKLDGRLELDVDHAEYWGVEYLIQTRLATPPAASPPTPPPAPVDADTPLRWDELAAPRQEWPFAWSLRRRLMLCLDTHDDPVSIDALLDDLQRLGQYRPDSVTPSSTRGAAFVRDADGRLSAARHDPEVRSARTLFRTWAQRIQADQNRAQEAAHNRDEHRRKRQEADAEDRRRFHAARKGILHLHAHGKDVAACILRFPEMTVQRFPPGTTAALRQTLESLDLAVGFDPRAAYERLEADLEGRRYLDVSPPFALAGRSLSAVVQDSVPWVPALTPPHEYDRLWSRGDLDPLMALLERDVRTIHEWYRAGVVRKAEVKETECGVESVHGVHDDGRPATLQNKFTPR